MFKKILDIFRPKDNTVWALKSTVYIDSHPDGLVVYKITGHPYIGDFLLPIFNPSNLDNNTIEECVHMLNRQTRQWNSIDSDFKSKNLSITKKPKLWERQKYQESINKLDDFLNDFYIKHAKTGQLGLKNVSRYNLHYNDVTNTVQINFF